MARSRPQMTSIDYLVIALSPALIMTLVGSLCFFLLEVFYRGQYEARLTWIMFWFVLGAVLIARISMEEGAEKASVYGITLAGAVALAMMRFVDSPFIAWSLMALVWWCAHKLTWDCTLIDDSQDSSGEGLLQVAGLGAEDAADEPGATGSTAAHAAMHDAEDEESNDDKRPKKQNWLARFWEDPEQRRRRPHAPGVWVVYFSLAALPLFGLGQAFVPAGDLSRRRYIFWLLLIYVASGMGLLLTTSFLGLRRYLRQRKLEMPLAMTGTWLSVGGALIVALILATLLIPRPSPEYPVEEMIAGALGSPTRQASQIAALNDSPGEGEGQRSGPSSAESPQGDAQSGQSPGQQGGSQGGQSSQGQSQAKGGQQGGNSSESQQSAGQQSGGQQSGSQGSSSPNQNASAQNQSQPGQNQQSSGQQTSGQQQSGSQNQNQPSPGQQGSNSPEANSSGRESQPPDQSKPKDQEKAPNQGNSGSSATQAQQQQSESSPPAREAPADSSSGQPGQPSEQQAGQQPVEQQQNPSSPDASNASPPRSLPRLPQLSDVPLASWIRWLMYAALAVAAIYGFLKYRQQVLAFLRQLWEELKAIFADLFGRKSRDDSEEQAPAAPLPRPFAAFQDPFLSGAAGRLPPDQLVRYTFDAMQAWAFERGAARRPDETPLEFASHLGSQAPQVADEARELARLYSQITYARGTLSSDCLPVLQRLWRQMRAAARPAATAAP